MSIKILTMRRLQIVKLGLKSFEYEDFNHEACGNNVIRSMYLRVYGKEKGNLLDVASNGFTVNDIKNIKSLRSQRHGLNLHLHWHI